MQKIIDWRSSLGQPPVAAMIANGVACRLDSPEFTILHPGGNFSGRPATVVCIATQAMILLHRGYIHPGSPFQLVTPTLETRECVTLTGEVTSCEHFEGSTHQSRVKLESPITLEDFVRIDEDRVEQVKLASASMPRGSLLVVVPEEAVRRMVQHRLRGLGIDLQLFDALPDAGLIAACDAAMVHVTDVQDARQALEAIRAAGVQGPVIGLCDEGLVGELAELGFGPSLTMPIDHDELLLTLERCLPGDTAGSDPMHSDLRHDPVARELIVWYVQRVSEAVAAIRKAVRWADVDEVRSHCRMLAETAASYGFAFVSRQAARVLRLLNDSDSIPRAAEEIDELERLCLRLA